MRLIAEIAEVEIKKEGKEDGLRKWNFFEPEHFYRRILESAVRLPSPTSQNTAWVFCATAELRRERSVEH